MKEYLSSLAMNREHEMLKQLEEAEKLLKKEVTEDSMSFYRYCVSEVMESQQAQKWLNGLHDSQH